MQNLKLQKGNYQAFPYHLVDPSPWPILVSFSLLSLMLGAVMYLHGFTYGGYFLTLGFTLTTFGMLLWFRDVITEATYTLTLFFKFILKNIIFISIQPGGYININWLY